MNGYKGGQVCYEREQTLLHGLMYMRKNNYPEEIRDLLFSLSPIRFMQQEEKGVDFLILMGIVIWIF